MIELNVEELLNLVITRLGEYNNGGIEKSSLVEALKLLTKRIKEE